MHLVASEVRNKRTDLGLTQKEFAAALGMGTNGERTVRRWEAGETAPSAAESAFISLLGHSAPFDQGERPDAPFTYVDLFAGIGGIRMPFQELGGRCVFSCEWDKFAQKTYRMNYGETPSGDIREVAADDIPDFDVLLAGFPCQPFSLAGVSKKRSLGRATGFEDETQGTLFFEVARIIDAKKPKAFLLENVKNLTSHDQGNTFRVIMHVLKDELGYDVHWKVLDSKHWTCQHRERIYIVGFSEPTELDWSNLEVPEVEHTAAEVLEADVDDRYVLSDKLWNYLKAYKAKHQAKGNGFGYSVIGPGDTTRTLSARYHKDGSEILVSRSEGKNPRKLTPRECARLQGFPDEFIIPVSDTQAYHQFGNSVTVPVVRSVAKLMIGAMENGLRSA
nr:DNA (cytosine-5-)-methyltransferase [Enorma phocaeensis]